MRVMIFSKSGGHAKVRLLIDRSSARWPKLWLPWTGKSTQSTVTRLIREAGPISDVAPEFPLAAGALAPLRAKAEAAGSGDFSPLWSGQAAALGRDLPAGELTKSLAAEAQAVLGRLAG
jgi:nitronate monooxygenase